MLTNTTGVGWLSASLSPLTLHTTSFGNDSPWHLGQAAHILLVWLENWGSEQRRHPTLGLANHATHPIPPHPTPSGPTSPPCSAELCPLLQVPGLAWTCLPGFLGATTSPVSLGCQAVQPPFPVSLPFINMQWAREMGGWGSFWGKISRNDKLSYSCKPSACYPWLCRMQTVRIWVTELAHQRHHQGSSPAHLAGRLCTRFPAPCRPMGRLPLTAPVPDAGTPPCCILKD